MNRIILIDAPESWERFVRSAIEPTSREILSCTIGNTQTLIRPEVGDLVILNAAEDRPPSATLDLLFRRLGPLRILVIDDKPGFSRAGDALRGCAIGYEIRP